MAGGRQFLAAAGRHRRTVVTVALCSALIAVAGLWVTAGQPARIHSRHIRPAITVAERTDFLPAALGRCQWPIRVHGKPARGQVYLTRCYLRALAQHDAASMRDLSEFVPKFGFRSQITSRDWADSADARTGVATAAFVQNPVDSAQTAIRITFADGARETLAAIDMSAALREPAASAGNAWRFPIGTKVRRLPGSR